METTGSKQAERDEEEEEEEREGEIRERDTHSSDRLASKHKQTKTQSGKSESARQRNFVVSPESCSVVVIALIQTTTAEMDVLQKHKLRTISFK